MLCFQVPNNRGPTRQEGWKKIQSLTSGWVKINGGLKVEKRFTGIIKWRRKQRQVVIKQKTYMHTEVHYFAFKVGLNNTKKERKYNKLFVKHFVFLKVNKRGIILSSPLVLIWSGGLEKSKN